MLQLPFRHCRDIFSSVILGNRYKVSSVDTDEVSKFSNAAKYALFSFFFKFICIFRDWWNPSSTLGSGPLHFLHIARVEFIRQSLRKSSLICEENKDCIRLLDGIKLLDVGCGGGMLAEVGQQSLI